MYTYDRYFYSILENEDGNKLQFFFCSSHTNSGLVAISLYVCVYA